MLTLFFAPGSSSMAAHIALHEVGAVFEARPLSFRSRENRAPDYLALNPEGKVPTLLVDGRPLTEVASILFYLARRYPEAGLLPGDAEGEARALSWMSYAAATLHPARRGGLDHAMAVWSIAESPSGRAALGAGPLLGGRHSRIPPVLAAECLALASFRLLPEPARSPRPHAITASRSAGARDRGRHRVRTAGLSKGLRAASGRLPQ